MTRQKSFKQRVRSRMTRTGESYTAARRHLIPVESTPAVPEPPTVVGDGPAVSAEAVRAATGGGWADWFLRLDAWGAVGQGHTAIARWLVDEHAVPSWWAQTITVEYERARGLRVVGQSCTGDFNASASKTVIAAPERVTAAFTDPALREQWLPGDPLRIRTCRPGRSLTADWIDPPSRVSVYLSVKGTGRTQVSVSHTKLPDTTAVAERKATWRTALADLKRLLEA